MIPLRGKVPTTAHGVKDASRDPAQVAEWWAGGATHNIGARVPAQLLVLDFDPQNGGTVADLEAASGITLPETLTVHSGRGTGGQHRYYLHPGGPLSSRRLPAGVDLKTSTGYCVVPPSVHPLTGKPYTWEDRAPVALPAAVLALLRPVVTDAPRPRPSATTVAAERVMFLVRHVERLAEGNRNRGLYWAACRAIEEGHDGDALAMLERAAVVAGLSAAEARQTIASARRAGVTA